MNTELGRESGHLTTEGLLIRNLRTKDLHVVQKIENACFDDPYSPIVFWALYFSPNRIFRVAILHESVIGYSIVKVETKDGGEELIAHLISLAVDPASRMRGVGSKLLEDSISQTKTGFPDCRSMELEVRMDNEPAITLYLKYGFRKTRIVSNYYGRGKDALVMRLDF